MLQKCSFLLLTFVTVSLGQCVRPSFNSTVVEVSQRGTLSRQVVDGCITPQRIFYKSGEDVNIVLRDAHVPTLQRGAIANIQEPLLLNFFGCNIKVIKEGAFTNLPRLQGVNIRNSNLNTIEPDNFQNMELLRGIYVEDNKIEYLFEETFVHLPNLLEVSFRRNRLRYFTQHWFNRTPKLEVLRLGNNLITSIPRSAFNTLPNLTTLDFGNNFVETLHREAFKGLSKLQILDLSNNNLKVVDCMFYSRLRIFDMQFNSITYISDETLRLLSNNPELNMIVNSNPLQCSCFDELLKWSANNNVTLFWICKDENPVCVIPKTNEVLCTKRNEDDFYEGYHVYFTKEYCKDSNSDKIFGINN